MEQAQYSKLKSYLKSKYKIDVNNIHKTTHIPYGDIDIGR
jgi:hypothetical protein